MESRGSQGLRGTLVCLVALVVALTVGPASAQAASPVLEFVSPGNSFPIHFQAEGGEVSARLGDFDKIVRCAGSEGSGELTGPRTTLSSYAFTGCVAEEIGGGPTLNCTTEGAAPNELRSATIEAEPVYLNQANHEVAMLLNPGGGVYLEFKCGAHVIKASGPFLAPAGPVNKLADSFSVVLKRNGNSQIPTLYEDLNGISRQAIPTAEVDDAQPDLSGVELAFTILPAASLEIKAINSAEIEAKQRQEDEAAAAKKRQEDEAAAKKRQEDEAAKAAAAKKLQEEEAAKRAAKQRQKERTQAKKRAQHRSKALRQCRKAKSSKKRTRCEKRVKNKYKAPRPHSRISAARF